jgi:hypothetical protein
MKKSLLGLVLSLAFAIPAMAANLYGGSVQAGSVGVSAAQTQGGSGAIFAGVSGTRSTANSFEGGVAGGSVGPAGVVTYQAGGAATNGGSASGALGAAAAGSSYGGGAGNLNGATGSYGTIGIGF